MNDVVATNLEPMFDLSSLDLPDLTNSFFSDKQTAILDGEKFVVFFLGDALFGIAAREVTEVIRPLGVTPLPGAPAWLYGIGNLRGEIISVLNLSEFCRTPARAVSAKSRLIVLRPKNYDASIAFPIDRLSELVTFAKDEIGPSEEMYFKGEALYQTERVCLLDTERIFSTLIGG